ncbi:apolipoprotein N-acyltransferase [Sulfitobacter sp. HNIBRBA2951]|uniref:apolipoprotein N-acyltransferase n=1 Tax=Sulfitobacter aquimarinus TaxID=3158557 RepID=UPI0032E0522D
MPDRNRRYLPLFAGVVAAMGQAPFDLPIAMIVGLAVAFRVMRHARTVRDAAWVGFAFGFGYFAVALHWIVSPFLVDAARHGWMAPFAVVLMAAGGALFWSLAFWTAARLRGFWMLVPCFAMVEVLRAYVFTGFPWAAPAQAMVDVPAGQALSWVGPHGLNLLIAAVAATLVVLRRRQGLAKWPLMALLVLPFLPLPLAWLPAGALGDSVVRLVQANAPQHEKWDPLMIPVFYDRQLTFTEAPPTEGMDAPALVIWPETAIPWRLDRSGVILEEIAAAANGAQVILGAQRSEGERHFNALVALDPLGNLSWIYDKHHLVPFGEYMPLGDLAARFGIYGMAPQHGAGFSRGAGAQVMDLGALGRALPLICYEAVFAHDVNAAPERPDFIVHATNDAWFGTYAGPQQHLAQARMRAIEQGLPVARAANTGVTAMIDPWGRVLSSIGLGQAGFLDARLPLPLAPTLYSRTGDLPAALLLLGVLSVGALRRRARQRAQSE